MRNLPLLKCIKKSKQKRPKKYRKTAPKQRNHYRLGSHPKNHLQSQRLNFSTLSQCISTIPSIFVSVSSDLSITEISHLFLYMHTVIIYQHCTSFKCCLRKMKSDSSSEKINNLKDSSTKQKVSSVHSTEKYNSLRWNLASTNDSRTSHHNQPPQCSSNKSSLTPVTKTLVLPSIPATRTWTKIP
jgi:hypothetical protein